MGIYTTPGAVTNDRMNMLYDRMDNTWLKFNQFILHGKNDEVRGIL